MCEGCRLKANRINSLKRQLSRLKNMTDPEAIKKRQSADAITKALQMKWD